MYMSSPCSEQISVRAIRRIKDDAIVKDLDKFSIDQRCVDVDTMVEMYDRFLSELLDKHAPLKKIIIINNNNICLKSNIQTSSVDCAPGDLLHNGCG